MSNDPYENLLNDTLGQDDEPAPVGVNIVTYNPEDLQEDPGTTMSEAEFRITKALLYKELLQGSFFDSNNTVIDEVEYEIREFVERKLQELLGMAVPVQVQKDFTEEQIIALRAWADKISSDAKLMSAISKAEPKEAVKEPKVVPRAPLVTNTIKEPALRTRTTPKSVGRPAGSKNKKPLAKPVAATPKPAVASDAIPKSGEKITEGGKRYEISHTSIDFSTQSFFPEDINRMRDLPIGKTLKTEDGFWIGRSGEKTYIKITKMPLRGGSAIDKDQLETIQAQQAMMATNQAVTNTSTVIMQPGNIAATYDIK